MRRLTAAVSISLASIGAIYAQRGGADWTTAGNDAQRSSWVKTDPKINKDSILKPDFKFLWKIKTASQPSEAVTLNSYIGYRGFRALAYVMGSSNNVTAIDTDLGRIEWQKTYGSAAGAAASAGCPGGSTGGMARPSTTAFAAPGGGRGFGGGRGSAAKGGVGEPGEGAVTIAEIAARAATAPPNMGRGGRGPGGPTPPLPPGATGVYNPFARGPAYVYLLSADGLLHAVYLSNGEEPNPPVKFLPPGANAQGLIIIDNVAYVTTSHSCGGVPDQVWALDLPTKEVATWKAGTGGIGGSEGAAFGPDATLFVTSGDVLMSLEPKTLKPKEAYKAAAPFTSSPVIFQYKDKTVIAAASKDGQIHLLDASIPGAGVARPGAEVNALSSWQDAGGTRWLLGAGGHAVTAWKVADDNGALTLQPGWTSRDLVAPLTPMIINGVVFTGSSGSRSAPAVIYALDGATGKDLWNSGKSITSHVQGGGLSGGSSQLYLGTADGTFYAFGFWIEH